MNSSRSAARLKRRMVSAALQDNLDVINGRLPPQLTPWRRRLRAWSRRLAVPGMLVLTVAVAGVARWTGAAPTAAPARVLPPSPARSAVAAMFPADSAGAVNERAVADRTPTLDKAVLSQAMPPGVLALSVRRVVIDAGHGGDNPGTSSTGGLKEKDVTLDIASRVQQILASRGFETVMTRTTDQTLSLRDRAATANTERGDIFVSIHLNWLKRPDDRGIETYYLGPSGDADLDAIAALENQQSGYSLADMRALLEKIYTNARRDESRRLAEVVQQSLIGTLRKNEPTLSDRGVKMAPFVVLGATEMPAILAEVSCLSNKEQAERMKTAEARQTIAEALVSGIQIFARESRVAAVRERTASHGG